MTLRWLRCAAGSPGKTFRCAWCRRRCSRGPAHGGSSGRVRGRLITRARTGRRWPEGMFPMNRGWSCRFSCSRTGSLVRGRSIPSRSGWLPLSGGGVRQHVPDFLVEDGDGGLTVVDVKPRRRVGDEKVRFTFGWNYRPGGEAGLGIRGIQRAGAGRPGERAVPFRCRRARQFDPAVLENAVAGGRPLPLADLEAADTQAARSQPAARAHVLHLLWSGGSGRFRPPAVGLDLGGVPAMRDTARIAIGTRLLRDGEMCEVVALEAAEAVIIDRRGMAARGSGSPTCCSRQGSGWRRQPAGRRLPGNRQGCCSALPATMPWRMRGSVPGPCPGGAVRLPVGVRGAGRAGRAAAAVRARHPADAALRGKGRGTGRDQPDGAALGTPLPGSRRPGWWTSAGRRSGRPWRGSTRGGRMPAGQCWMSRSTSPA